MAKQERPRYEVIGPCPVAGARKGDTVELDPAAVNVDALIQAGHVRPAKRTGGAA